MNLIEIGQRLVVLRVLADLVGDETKTVRAVAEKEYRTARVASGIKSTEVTLPDGTPVATVAIKAGGKSVTVDDKELLAWVEVNAPTEVEEYADPSVLTDPELLAWLRENRPGKVERRVRQVFRKAKVDEAGKNKGYIVNKDTGETTKVADVTTDLPTGAFALTPTKDGLAEVLAALRAGELAHVTPFAIAAPAGGTE